MTWAEIESELFSIIDECASRMDSSHLKMACELALAGEYGVGLDALCSQIYEYETLISNGIYQRIERLGSAMQMDSSTWTLLTDLIESK